MLRHLLLSIYFLLTLYTSSAQADSILALPAASQLKALDIIFALPPEKTPALFKQFEDLKKEFRLKNREDLVQHIIFLITDFKIRQPAPNDPDAWLPIINKEIASARENDWPLLESALFIIRGTRLAEYGQSLPAIESMLRGCEIRDRLGWPNDHVSVRLLNHVGLEYYKFKDYRGAIPFLKHSLAIDLPQPDHGTTFNIYNTLAICYRKLERYDSAMYYFQLARDDVAPLQDAFATDLINGNIGHIYYLQGKYDEAHPYLEKDYQSSLATNEFGSAVNAGLLLAIIEQSKGNLTKAAAYIEFCKQHRPGREPIYQQIYYECMNKYSKLLGDFVSASHYADSLITVEHLLNKENDKRMIDQAKLSLEIEQHKSEMQFLEGKRSRQVLIRNAMVVIMVLLCLLALLMIRTIQEKRKKETEMSAIREHAANEKLSKAQHQLQHFTQTLLEKNEMLKGFKEEIDFLHADQMDHRTARVQELVHQSILTEADWRHFRQLFDEVHPGFLIRLKEKINDITPAEMRLVALTRLQITPKEMADMLGISVESVKKTRHRLRKKIHLPEDGDFEELVALI